MATLMDFIMAQRGDQNDPRFAANQQAMELQNIAASAPRSAMPPAFAGQLSPFAAPQRAPMMMSAPPLSPLPPPVPSSAYSGYGGMDSPRERIAMATGMPAAPMPPPRPAMPMQPAGAPMQLASAPSVREGFMQRLLGGPNYQSNNMPVVLQPQGPTPSGAPLPQQVNWGDADSSADFFRAEQMARQMGLLG